MPTSMRPFSVHPHARGEHFARQFRRPRHHGSSPRAWGTLMPDALFADTRRFIPTRVGNTPPTHQQKPPASVHPHARGEHAHATPLAERKFGSSPRAWGTHFERALVRPGKRFIPTRVGNTDVGITVEGPQTVHPHARGEHNFRCYGMLLFNGSSPRAWGTLSSTSQKE